jgi:putative membrane protein
MPGEPSGKPEIPGKPAIAEQDPRVYFAAERTFLAWIRTGLALMGFGFVVARFGLFLRELQDRDLRLPSHATGFSLWLGIALVGLGVTVDVSAAAGHVRLTHKLREGTWLPGRTSALGLAVALLLAGVGLAMAIYFLRVH